MSMVEALIGLFGVAGAMVFFIGSLILIKGVEKRFLSNPNREDQWLNKRH